MVARDGDGNRVPSRNPLIEIDHEPDGDLGTFNDPANGDLLGTYYSRVSRIDGVVANSHTLTAIGMSSTTPVTLNADVEVADPGGWSRTPLVPIEIPMGASATEGWRTSVSMPRPGPSSMTTRGRSSRPRPRSAPRPAPPRWR